MTPYVIINLSSTEHLYLPKKHVVAFAEKDDTNGEVFEIDNLDTTPRNWVPEQTRQTFAQFAPIEAETNLHKVLTTATNFIKSPADVETHRKVDLKDAQIKEETKGKFHDLCNRFDSIISKSSGDIGKTLLIEMNIDTGNSPPPSRPDHIPTHCNIMNGSVKKSAHWKEQASSPKASHHGHHPWSLYRRNLLQENHHKEGCVLTSENSTKHNQRYTT